MLYFDTSFVVPFILPEPTSSRIQQFFSEHQNEELAISDWTRVEFASMLTREVRMGGLTEQKAREADARFEEAMTRSFAILPPNRTDFDLCKRYLMKFETGVRLGDALHLAIVHNHNAQIFYTLDKKLVRIANSLGLPVATGL